ncbi:sugar ABC transporter substrate-binding protein [Humibacter ginsenosidimutans]|uniref:Extracellular solute-binding protein n=1 Tax=Humibacter ginsenosidimutans TaxID=2599293 RepID=A0A5B8M5Z4_9MICO|nr:sugar ABC transporter substrate-binding protein [Humibacter ginsenosidimutans]QDZ16208.1 extracellular solute-binding protein [Humibacter ginsenosidimutans]
MLRKLRPAVIAAVALTAALALTSCSSGGTASGGDKGTDLAKVDGKGKTLSVWVMNGDLSQKTVDAINVKFEKATGAKVKVQIQQWDGITTKLNTALAGSSAPDVVDVGNTQVASYAASGGLADLTSYKSQLEQGQTWLGGLVDPATIDGKLYGVPSFAGDRAVVYNKKMWAEAGITTTPTTYDEFTADLDKIKAKNTATNFSPIYVPGQQWYVGVQFVWDAGGEIAAKHGSSWKAGFSSAAAQKGLKQFKEFQNSYSTAASRTLNTDVPDQDAVFANGQTSALMTTSAHITKIIGQNAALKDEIGTFPLPGISGKNQPVMLGGSVWSVAQKSKQKDLAAAWTRIAASPEIQNDYVFGTDNWIPNSEQGIKKAQNSGLNDQAKGFFTAALRSKATPAAANWATIEGDKTMEQFFQSIVTGTDVSDAAAKTDAHIETTLNSK